MDSAALIPSVNLMTAGIIVFFALFLPVILTSIGMALKWIDFKGYLCGFAVFLFSELLIRAPIISALLTDSSFKTFASSLAGLAVVGGLSAALIEDTAKYIAAGRFLKNDLSYKTAISLGFGSLCCEIIFVLGFKYIGTLITMIVINSGSYSDTDISNIRGTAQVIAEMTAISPVTMIFELAARISKGMFFLFSGVIIMKAIQQKNLIYWLMSVLLHTLFNCVLLLIPNIYAANCIALFIGFMFMMYSILARDEFAPAPRRRKNGGKRPANAPRTGQTTTESHLRYGKMKNTYYEKSGIDKVVNKKTSNYIQPKKRIEHEETEGERDLMAELAKLIVQNDIFDKSDLAGNPPAGNTKRSPLNSEKENEKNYSPGQNIREIYRRNMNNYKK